MTNQTDKKSASDAVKKWLIDSGYPLEMYVAAAFRKDGKFVVSQGETYVDPDTQDVREIDVVAVKYEMAGRHGIEFNVRIECKRSSGKPWVAFLAHAQDVSLHEYTACDFGTRSILRFATEELKRRNLPLFQTKGHAYGMTQTLRAKDGNDESYRASMQIIKATERHLAHANAQFIRDGFDPAKTDLVTVVPAIVVDTDLYTAQLSDFVSDIVLTPVNRLVILTNQGRTTGTMPIYVISKLGLDRFVADVIQASAVWTAWITSNVGRIEETVKKELPSIVRRL